MSFWQDKEIATGEETECFRHVLFLETSLSKIDEEEKLNAPSLANLLECRDEPALDAD